METQSFTESRRRTRGRKARPAPLTKYGHLQAQLELHRSTTLDAILSYVPSHEPQRHLYSLVPVYPQRGGKAFRPGLCLATCGALGGDKRLAQRSAAAIELFHNAFLVHDDIEDGSESRRGAPTLHEQEGVPIAVNVGDAMNVLSLRPLLENVQVLGAELALRIMHEVEHMVRESVEGQAVELGWVRDNVCELEDADYLRMILKKTCWYTCIHPMRIGALIGTGGAIDPERYNRFGYYLGAAFQIQDDLLNLVGDEARYGKEIAGDLWEGKRTLMLLHLFRSMRGADQRRLRTFLAKPRGVRDEQTVTWVLERMHGLGSIAHGQSCARQLAGAALREFHALYGSLPNSDDKRAVEELVMYMVEREL